MTVAFMKPPLSLALATSILLMCPLLPRQNPSSAGSPATVNKYRDNGLAYFPTGTFKKLDGSSNDDWADSWAWYLRDRGEPPLLHSTDDSQTQVYRLTVVGFPGAKTWIFRLQIKVDATGILFTKITPFNARNFILNKQEAISAADVSGFLDSVKRARFWQLPTTEQPEKEMPDGSYWFLEGTRDSEYHLVYRRSPEAKPSPYTDIGRYLSKDLAKLPDSTIRIPRSN
jgi:hypothetical protein